VTGVSVHIKPTFAENGRNLALLMNDFCYQTVSKTLLAVLIALEVFMGSILKD
jgi:hypothetical protein